MKTTKRFDEAVSKLYNAFHENRLDPLDCMACAVGNICDNESTWFDSVHNKDFNKRNIPESVSIKTGYSEKELESIETMFIYGVKHRKEKMLFHNGYGNTKETQFLGLCAVVEYLCELDNIPNVMDYKKLFEQEENKPKYELKL